MIRKADIEDLSRIAEIIVFGKRVAYRHIFEDDYGSFHKLQVVDLYEEYKSNLNVLEGMLLYDDGIVKGVINGRPKESRIMEITDFYVEPFFVGQGIIKDNAGARKFYEMNGFANSGETRIIQGTAKEDCCYEYVFE